MPERIGKHTLNQAKVIAVRHGHRIKTTPYNEYVVTGPYFPTGYFTNDIEDAINTLMFEVDRHSKTNPKTGKFKGMSSSFVSMSLVDISKAIKAIKKRYKDTNGNITRDEHNLLYELTDEFNRRVIRAKGGNNPAPEGYKCFCGAKATQLFSTKKGAIAWLCPKCHRKFSDPNFLATRKVDTTRTHKILPNPRGVLIYGKVNRIIATKLQKHICDVECKKHGHRYFHDFTSRAKMYGLPNGDLLITTR